MSGEHRDEIYLRIEAERLNQERHGYTATTLWNECRAVIKVLVGIMTDVSAVESRKGSNEA